MLEHKSALRSPQERRTKRRLWLVHGAVVLPTTDVGGHAVVVVKQPGEESRQDILLIEKPASVTIRSKMVEERRDVRAGRHHQTRLRVMMEQLARDGGA